jgi:Tol biopolymer transport system component
LRDVPAQRLAYAFTADTDAPAQGSATDEANNLLPAIQSDFDTRRKDDALLRTQLSPDRQRALVIYATGADEPNEFRLDLYGADGNFLRHVTPEGLALVFAPVAAWSPDGNYISFIAYKSSTPQPTPTPFEDLEPEALPSLPSASPTSTPGVAPLVPFFTTEQVYLCNRDGYDLKALTTREGLIYFYLAWSPDSHALAALACREEEWRERPRSPVGRPRLIGLDGSERLLDDGLTDVLPVWSPDASRVATAFETEVKIYDALTDAPTQAAIKLGEPLLAASRAYDTREAQKGRQSASGTASPGDKPPVSFNPIVTLVWPQPETLYMQTGYVRNFENEQVRNFMRWHLLKLSAQAALLN